MDVDSIVSLVEQIREKHSKDPAFKDYKKRIVEVLMTRAKKPWEYAQDQGSSSGAKTRTIPAEYLRECELCTAANLRLLTPGAEDENEGKLHRLLAYTKCWQDDLTTAEVHVAKAELVAPRSASTVRQARCTCLHIYGTCEHVHACRFLRGLRFVLVSCCR